MKKLLIGLALLLGILGIANATNCVNFLTHTANCGAANPTITLVGSIIPPPSTHCSDTEPSLLLNTFNLPCSNGPSESIVIFYIGDAYNPVGLPFLYGCPFNITGHVTSLDPIVATNGSISLPILLSDPIYDFTAALFVQAVIGTPQNCTGSTYDISVSKFVSLSFF